LETSLQPGFPTSSLVWVAALTGQLYSSDACDSRSL